MATKQVRKLFNLPASENIYDDFSCSLGPKPGRIYLSQNHLCFYSSLLGRTTVLTPSFDRITEVHKSNNRVGARSIKIHVKALNGPTTSAPDQGSAQEAAADAGKEETYKFSGFQDRDMTFKYIRRLWSTVSPYADDDSSESS